MSQPRDAQIAALQIGDVSKRYGSVAALDSVTLSVARGECLAIVGASGSGKSTLLRCVARLTSWDTGTILLDGEDIRAGDAVHHRRRLGYVPQEDSLLPHWSVARNVLLVPWLARQHVSADRASELLAMVGLDPALASRFPHELSGGQRQRVAVARSLAGSPKLLLLDEPFGALDAITRFELQHMLRDLRARAGFTSLLVTHDLREAALVADTIAVFNAGRVEQVAPARRLVAAPASNYVAQLVERSGMAAAAI